MPSDQADAVTADSDGGASGISASQAAGPAGRRVLTLALKLIGSKWIKIGFVVCAVGLAAYSGAEDWKRIWPALTSLGVPIVLGALACGLLALATTAMVWRALLGGLGSPLPIRTAAGILFVGQLGKYLPGSIWPVLAQMELGRAHDVPRPRSASASVLAMVLSVITGLLTALVTLPFVAGSMPYRWALLAAPVLLVLLYPRVLNGIMAWLLRLARQPQLEMTLTARTLVRALAWSFGTWICFGLQIWLLATQLGAPAGKTMVLAIGGFALAWSVGFIVVIAPAGAGVRDVLLLLMLGLVLSSAKATAVMITSRAVLTLADLIAAAVAARLARQARRSVDDLGVRPDLP